MKENKNLPLWERPVVKNIGEQLHLQSLFIHRQQNSLKNGDMELYYALYTKNNLTFWRNWFEISNQDLKAICHFRNDRQLIEARERLINQGLILYLKRGTRQPGLYHMVEFIQNSDQIVEASETDIEQALHVLDQSDITHNLRDKADQFEWVKEYWNMRIPSPKILKITYLNALSLDQVIRAYGEENLKRAIDQWSKNSFLQSKDQKNLNASIDWLLKSDHIIKVLESTDALIISQSEGQNHENRIHGILNSCDDYVMAFLDTDLSENDLQEVNLRESKNSKKEQEKKKDAPDKTAKESGA